jgi:hypothetical protein
MGRKRKFVLTNENYYSREADQIYMSVSQFKDFHGSYGMPGCERTAMLRLRGEYPPKSGLPLLVGGYVDAYFEGTLDAYKTEHPEMFKKDGTLKADFVKADAIIERVNNDPMFMYYMSGEKQRIMTGEIDGIPWKIKIDSLLPDTIVDLKVIAEISRKKWVPDLGEFLDFIRYWGYDIQGAVYQEIVRQNTGKKLPFIIAAVSKEDPEPDIELIEVDQVYLDEAMNLVRNNAPRIADIKKGLIEPTQCFTCPCCRKDKVLTGAIKLSQLYNQK